MSYVENGGFADFFAPMMAVAANDTKPACAIDIGASSGTHGEWVCIKPCSVQRLLFAVSLEAASGTTTAPTVVFKKRPTPGSSTSESTLGTLTIPSGTAIGVTVYKDITPVSFAVGQSIQVSWTIGVGTPTGQGNADIEASYSPEYYGNNSNMLASS